MDQDRPNNPALSADNPNATLLSALGVCRLLDIGNEGTARTSRQSLLRKLRLRSDFPDPVMIAGKALWRRDTVLAWVELQAAHQRKEKADPADRLRGAALNHHLTAIEPTLEAARQIERDAGERDD